MKKAIGILLLVIGGVFLLSSIISFSISLYNEQFVDEPITTIVAIFIIPSFIALLLCFVGFRLVRSGSNHSKLLNDLESIEIREIIITNYLSFNEFVKLNFLLTYSNPIYIFLTFIGFMNLMFLMVQNSALSQFPWYSLIIGFVFTFIIPVSIYFQSKKYYYSNQFLTNSTIFHISEHQIKAENPNFNGLFDINKLHKALEMKNFFLIYTDKINAYIFPKKNFNSSEEIDVIRKILLKNNIKISYK